LYVVKQPDNDKEAGNLNRTVSMTGKKDQGKVLENIATMLFLGTEVSSSTYSRSSLLIKILTLDASIGSEDYKMRTLCRTCLRFERRHFIWKAFRLRAQVRNL
jgi:hypothetical protein